MALLTKETKHESYAPHHFPLGFGFEYPTFYMQEISLLKQIVKNPGRIDFSEAVGVDGIIFDEQFQQSFPLVRGQSEQVQISVGQNKKFRKKGRFLKAWGNRMQGA